MSWIGTVVQLPGQSMEEATANINQWLCAYDTSVHGKRKANKLAKRAGREYIFKGANVGQPRIVEAAAEPFAGQELRGLDHLNEFEKGRHEMTATTEYLTEEFVDAVADRVLAFMSNHAAEAAEGGNLVMWDLDGLERDAIPQLIAEHLAQDGYSFEGADLAGVAKAVRSRVEAHMTGDPTNAIGAD